MSGHGRLIVENENIDTMVDIVDAVSDGLRTTTGEAIYTWTLLLAALLDGAEQDVKEALRKAVDDALTSPGFDGAIGDTPQMAELRRLCGVRPSPILEPRMEG